MRERKPRDEIIARLRPHARALVWPTVLLIAVAGGLGYIGGRLPEEWQNWAVVAVAALLILFGWLVPLTRWMSRRYTITSRRVIVKQGGTRRELLHSRSYDVSVRKRGLQALFGSGDVTINAGLDLPVVMRDVPSANLVQETLNELMEAHRHDLSIE